MAVTGFWPVYGNLKATLDYADNPDKTTPKECLDKDLYSALRYDLCESVLLQCASYLYFYCSED